MELYNHEHYADPTAFEAIRNTMPHNREKAEAADNNGCLRLIEDVIRQAIADHLHALRRLPDPEARRQLAETEAFFRSERFRRLTRFDGQKVLRMIRKERDFE